ncbi:MAG: HAD family hydrolase [Capsulimonadaceae bacterium]|nr:HAD family hydrolase [Capsulimonadaceae bacterium]
MASKTVMIDPTVPRGVLFDLDNTLHDRDQAFVDWARAFVRREAHITDPSEEREAIDLILSLDRGGEGDKLEMFQTLRARYPAIEPSADILLAAFFAHRTDYMMLSDNVERLLNVLDRRAIPWGIVTNGRAEQWDKLRRLNLHGAGAKCILVSHEFGRAKPHPSIFLAAAEKLGVSPGDVLFVGDHPVNDIAGARGASLRTAWLRRGREWPAEMRETPPEIILDDIGQLSVLFAGNAEPLSVEEAAKAAKSC